MGKTFDANRPIYIQIMEMFKDKLTGGQLLPGDRIQSVRELALEYGVNPNTMQKALAELERGGYLFSERTAGRCVTLDAAVIQKLKREQCDAVVSRFVQQMQALGIPRDQLVAHIVDYLQNNKRNEEEVT